MSETISQLASGNPAQATDLIPIARSGVNYSITPASIVALVPTTVGPRPNRGNWHGWSCNGTGSAGGAVPYSDGVSTAQNGGGSFGVTYATSNEPQYFTVVTSTNPGCCGLYNCPQYGGFTVGIRASTMQRIMASSGTTVRYWIGAIDSSIGAPIGAEDLQTDAPAVAFIGFRYSTSAGDTNWQAVCTTGSHQTTVDTGIAIDTAAGHVFEMQGSSGSVVFLIDSTIVATIATDVSTDVLRPINDVENLASAVVTMSVAYMYWETTV